MSSPPLDRTEFWIRFGCGFIFFGLLFALVGLRFVDAIGITPAAAGCLVATLATSYYVARIGDDGWRNMLGLFRWW